jgi:hypothetical protein
MNIVNSKGGEKSERIWRTAHILPNGKHNKTLHIKISTAIL